MKRLAGCLSLLVSCIVAVRGQSPVPTRLDSLHSRLAATAADTNRVRVLEQLADELTATNVAQSLRYGQQGVRLARQLRDGYGEVLLLNALGQTYFHEEDLHNAARSYQQAVRRAGQVPRAGRQLTLALLGLGRVAVMQRDYPEAQRFFRQALRRMQAAGRSASPKDVTIAHNNLGILYFDWLGSGQAYPDSVRRLCLYYNRLALNALKQGRDEASLGVGLNGMAHVHRVNKRYDSTEYYHRAALRVFQRSGSAYDIAQTQAWLGDVLVARDKAPEAVPLLRAALRQANQLHHAALQADCSMELAEALAATGQGAAAYQLSRQGQALLDSLQGADQRANLTRLRVQFDTEQERNRVRELTQQTRLQQLETRRQRQYVWWLSSLLLAVAVGLVASGLLALRLRRQRTELAVARAEQDRLYALIAHDLRSPVLAFSGLANLLTAYIERQDTARLLGLGGRVRQTAESLREMLENLLHWALSQRGELRPVPAAVPVAPLLAEVGQLYQASAEAAGIRLTVLPAPDAAVLADRNMTLTILRNLISNALQATPAGGQVTVQATAPDAASLTIEVVDTGAGMSEETLARASGKELPATAHYRGRAGLGLRLSRRFAQVQGGQLSLVSQLGQGTAARLLLPQAS